MLASFQRELLSGLAGGTFESQHDLFGGLRFLVYRCVRVNRKLSKTMDRGSDERREVS